MTRPLTGGERLRAIRPLPARDDPDPPQLLPRPAASALAAAQGEFGEIRKTKTATVNTEKASYAYSYADLADLLAAVTPALSAHGLALTSRIGRESHTAILIHGESGDSLECTVPLFVASGARMNPAQQHISALTYARRAAISALLGVAADDDDDGQQLDGPGGGSGQGRGGGSGRRQGAAAKGGGRGSGGRAQSSGADGGKARGQGTDEDAAQGDQAGAAKSNEPPKQTTKQVADDMIETFEACETWDAITHAQAATAETMVRLKEKDEKHWERAHAVLNARLEALHGDD